MDILAAQLLGDLLCIGLHIAAYRVGLFSGGQAVHLKLQCIPTGLARIIAQRQFGTTAIRRGQIRLSGGRRCDIHSACTLLARRIRVGACKDRLCGAHQQRIDQCSLVGFGARQFLLLNVLLDQCHCA